MFVVVCIDGCLKIRQDDRLRQGGLISFEAGSAFSM